MSKLPNRQAFRAKWHDYNCGLYFVTVCTLDKKHYFGHIANSEMTLSAIGAELDMNIRNINTHHPDATMVNHVVMPNHVHMVIDIGKKVIMPWCDGVQTHYNSRLATIVGGIKSHLTKFCNEKQLKFGWQKSFHDHIIRHTQEFHNIMDYVDNNPARWDQDCYL